jgi:Ca2+-binding RTX toxin-like protein
MTLFAGTSGNDTANSLTNTLTGFPANTLTELTDPIGDVFNAGDGNDLIVSGVGDDTLNGGNGNDMLNGGAGINTLNGGAGDDLIASSSIFDTIDGGTGNDYLKIDPNSSTDIYVGFTGGNAGTVSAPAGPRGSFQNIEQFYFYGGSGNDYIDASLSTLTITSQGLSDPALRLRGDRGNDTLIGGASNDTIGGDDGDDILLGNAGNDTISGGFGLDYLAGGDGNDTLYGDFVSDSVSGVTDFLYGGNGDDILNGGGGDDILLGEVGSNYSADGIGETGWPMNS